MPSLLFACLSVLRTAVGMSRVLAAQRWRNNAEMIVDVAKLWYRAGDRVLDPTYGDGKWWTLFQPKKFVHSDLLDGVDVRYLPHRARSFDVVAFDPPYVSTGGRDTSTLPAFQAAYGLKGAPKSPRALQDDLIRPGLQEAHRVLRPDGRVWVKCMNYVSSGALFLGVTETVMDAWECGFEVVDEFIYVGNAGPQPKKNLDGSERRQVHAAHNASVLLVLRKR